MSILNPYVLLFIILTMLSCLGGGYYKGKHDEYNRNQIEIARLNDEARQTERRMGEVATTYAQALRKSQNAAKLKEDKLRTDLATGERKLFIPVKTECPVQAAGDAATPGGNTETRAELDGRVAQALVDLTSRGDQAIRQLNTCIDTYEKMRSFK